MSTERIQELSEIFKTGKRGAVIAAGEEAIAEIFNLRNQYSISLDAVYKRWPKCGQAVKKLKTLAGL